MKKSLFPRLALMAVVVALVSACSQKKQEYTDVIPANAHTVVSINLKSLADKAGLNDKGEQRSTGKADECFEEWHECCNIPASGNDNERSEEIGNRCIGTFVYLHHGNIPYYYRCQSQQ